MTVVPCEKNKNLRMQIETFAEVLKTEAHNLGAHGLEERDFYQGGLFRGAIERIRGQYSATMRGKKEFVRHVLNHMQDRGFIKDWDVAGDANRHDYSVRLPTGKMAVIELKGCLDGNNTNIFERPSHAQEFIIWSVCSNAGADPRRNAWSGIHTRLSAEIIERGKRVDGVMIWDWLCGTIGRTCPKLEASADRRTSVGPYQLTPPCIYVFPGAVPSVRNNPRPVPQSLEDVQILKAFNECFLGKPEEINYVSFEVGYQGTDIARTTRISRGGVNQHESNPTAIHRS
jgi:hypothetical protein